MASKYSVSLDKLIKEFGFETLYLPEDAHDYPLHRRTLIGRVLFLPDVMIILTRNVCSFWGFRK